MADKEALMKEYKQLAKRADERLRKLEKLSTQEHYKGVESYAYARAMRDIQQWSGEEAKRFNVKAPKSVQQLQAKINDIKTFLEAPTSTKTGITNMYKQRANTTNAKYGTNFTWQELATYYESGINEKISNQIKASKTVVRALGAIKKSGIKPEEIQQAIESNRKIAKDDVVNEVALRLLKQGFTADELFK